MQSGFFGLFMLSQRKLLGLGIFFVVLALHMALNLIFENNFVANLPNITFAWGLLYPPSLYLFFKELWYRDFKWQKHDIVHYVPFCLLIACVIIGINVQNALPIIMPTIILGYFIATAVMLMRVKRIAFEQYSSDIKPIMHWSYLILINYFVIIAFDLVRSIIQHFSPQSGPWMGPLQSVLLLTLVNIMLVKRLNSPKIFAGVSEQDQIINKSDMSAAEKDEPSYIALISSLDFIMETEKLYLQNGLVLKDIADQLKVHSKQLSLAINSIHNKSFSEYIATLRTEEAKIRLTETADPITTILYDVGFNSKAAFNNTFKKLVGMTPSQYRNLQK